MTKLTKKEKTILAQTFLNSDADGYAGLMTDEEHDKLCEKMKAWR